MDNENVAVTSENLNVTPQPEDKLTWRNLFMFALGTLGRDFLYNFFNGYLITFILFTKSLDAAQFGSITFIIVAARIFDAFNDPIMGGIVENTRTKWGRYKPWQLIGSVLTAGVVVMLFNVDLDGWAFIGFLAFAYFMFSITFTMNDISYWGMMPTLTSNPHDRDRLMSVTQIVCSIGGGMAGLLVPILTTGPIGEFVFGSAVTGYKVLSGLVGAMMVGFQLFTILGVKEKPLALDLEKKPAMKLKDMFKVLFKNDQLLWAALTMLLFNIGTNVFVSGGGMIYSYLEFGYDGTLWTIFGIGYAIISVAFTLFYPEISKRWGRDKVLYSACLAIIIGFSVLLIVGLALPKITLFEVLGVKITLKFLLMMICYTAIGWGSGFYLIGVINISNTVEYNEFKTGDRKEGLIFSLRPFTAKMGSAIMQGLLSLSYIIAGVLTTTNGISDLENEAARNPGFEGKMDGINELIANVPEKNKMVLLTCLCVIPIVCLTAALLLHKFKFRLNERTMNYMIGEIAKREGPEEVNMTAQEIFDAALRADMRAPEAAITEAAITEEPLTEETVSEETIIEETIIEEVAAEIADEPIIEESPVEEPAEEIMEETTEEPAEE